jgi:hypothetical protein
MKTWQKRAILYYPGSKPVLPGELAELVREQRLLPATASAANEKSFERNKTRIVRMSSAKKMI